MTKKYRIRKSRSAGGEHPIYCLEKKTLFWWKSVAEAVCWSDDEAIQKFSFFLLDDGLPIVTIATLEVGEKTVEARKS